MCDQVEYLMPTPIILQFAAVKGPLPWLSWDEVGWCKSEDWRFLVKATYEGMIEPAPSNVHEVWRWLHKFLGLEMVKIFMWLACSGKLMTNDKRECVGTLRRIAIV
ncbi:hypothetical protein V6N13_006109 [Hibiscus sabdariffa]